MKVLLDILILNISFLFAFTLRMGIGHFVTEPPTWFIPRYSMALIYLNTLYLFIFFMYGYYSKMSEKRANLEIIIASFTEVIIGLVIMVGALFLSRDWWISRGILLIFFLIYGAMLSSLRIYLKNRTRGGEIPDELKAIQADDSRDKLTVIIVNYNSGEYLTNCLKSLIENSSDRSIKIVVVDNKSRDASISAAQSKYQNATYMMNEKNVGFSRAINQAIRQNPSDYYLILNPDITILPGSIEKMMWVMRNDPQIGLAACKLLNEDWTLQYSSRTFLDIQTILYRFTPLRGLFANSYLEKKHLMKDWDHNSSREVDWVLGGCMLIKGRALEKIGLLDEKIFLYFDDIDLCYRMWEGGWKVYYVAEASMVHKHIRKSANQLTSRATMEHIKSLLYYLRKYKLKLIPSNCPSARGAS